MTESDKMLEFAIETMPSEDGPLADSQNAGKEYLQDLSDVWIFFSST